MTREQLDFSAISGPIPNRGLLQPDIDMFGLTYLQQISDANLNAGLHIEPGVWAAVPATSDPKETPTVARLASIRHGDGGPGQRRYVGRGAVHSQHRH